MTRCECTVEWKEYFAQLSAAVKIDSGLEIQSLPKCLFLNVFSEIYCLTKVDVLGNWDVSIFVLYICGVFLFCFIPGYPKLTLYVPKMASKFTSSYYSSIFNELACPLVAAFKIDELQICQTPQSSH